MREMSISTLIICICSLLRTKWKCGNEREKHNNVPNDKKSKRQKHSVENYNLHIVSGYLFIMHIYNDVERFSVDVHFVESNRWTLLWSHVEFSVFPERNFWPAMEFLLNFLSQRKRFETVELESDSRSSGRLLIFRFGSFRNLKQTLEILLFHGSRDPENNLNRLSWMVNCFWYVNPLSLLPWFPRVSQVNSTFKLSLSLFWERLWVVIKLSSVSNASSCFFKFSN